MSDSTSRGHGGKGGWVLNPMDCGAVGNGTTEYDEVSWINERMLQLVPSLKDASDFSATNVPDNLYLITLNHNRLSSSKELAQSQHMNAFNKIARGVEIWHYLGDSRGKALAEKASAAIAEALGIPNRGAKATTDLYVVSNTNATCLLNEWIFIDNKADYDAWVKNKEKAVVAALKAIGYTVVGGGEAVKPNPPVNKPKPPVKRRHNVRTYWFDPKSPSLKKVLDYNKAKKYNHKQTKAADGRIMVETFWFNQDSPGKDDLIKFYEKNYWSYDIQIEKK